MQMNKSFWITITAMILSAIFGYFANVYANKQNNALLVQLLKDQLQCVNNQIQSQGTSRVTSDLYAKRDLLQSQLNYYSRKFGIA